MAEEVPGEGQGHRAEGRGADDHRHGDPLDRPEVTATEVAGQGQCAAVALDSRVKPEQGRVEHGRRDRDGDEQQEHRQDHEEHARRQRLSRGDPISQGPSGKAGDAGEGGLNRQQPDGHPAGKAAVAEDRDLVKDEAGRDHRAGGHRGDDLPEGGGPDRLGGGPGGVGSRGTVGLLRAGRSGGAVDVVEAEILGPVPDEEQGGDRQQGPDGQAEDDPGPSPAEALDHRHVAGRKEHE